MAMEKTGENLTPLQDGEAFEPMMRVALYRVALRTTEGKDVTFETLDDKAMSELVELMREVGPSAVTEMAIEMGELEAPMSSDYLHGFYTVDDLQEVIVEIVAGVRGTTTASVESAEFMLVVFDGMYDAEFPLVDLAVWSKEEWEDFKKMADSGATYPVGIPLGENNGLIWLTPEDVRQQVQATELGVMGHVFDSMFSKLPSGNILNAMFEAFFENTFEAAAELVGLEAEEVKGYGDDEGYP